MDEKTQTLEDGKKVLQQYMLQAAEFLGFNGPLPTIIIESLPTQKIKDFPGLGTFHFPSVIPGYEHNVILVFEDWLIDQVKFFRPAILRSVISYFTYGFKYFFETGYGIESYPLNREGILVSLAIQNLEGVPFIEHPFISKTEITDCIKKYKGIETAFHQSISVTGRKSYGLHLSSSSRDKILSEYNSMHNRVPISNIPDFEKGTKENPFEDIDEACEYLRKLEEEVAAKDQFLNSSFLNDKFCIGFSVSPEAEDIFGDADMAPYEIPWASMFTAHKPTRIPRNSFVVSQLMAEAFMKPKFALKPNLSGRKFLYRGQNEEYIDNETKLPSCCANAYRGDADTNPFSYRIKAYHMVSLIERHPLALQLGIKGVKIFNEPFYFQLNRLGLTQHYYNKSKFLDLTSDLEVARFFACGKYDDKSDNYKPFVDTSKLGIIYVYELNMPGAFHPYQTEKGLVHLSSIGKQYVFMRSGMQSGFLLDMPKGLHLHELKNVRRFYFRHKPEKSQEIVKKADNGKVYFPEDDLSRYWKKLRVADNREFTICQNTRDLYMKLHPTEFKTRGELAKRLKAEGFNLSKEEAPEFPYDILQDYYKDIQNGGWERFCSDIHFYGTEGIFMKRALLQLPRNPAYRAAFYKN